MGPGLLSPVIKVLLIANIGFFLLQYLIPQLTFYGALTPTDFFNGFPLYVYQVVTYMFLHGGFFHLLFNMLALWMFGTEIEYTWGSRTFLRFYLIGGIAGAALTLIVYAVTGGAPALGASGGPVVGASAAIYALLMAYWLMFPDRLLYLYFFFPVPVKFAIPIMMIIGFFAGGANGGTAHMAHLGGAIFGLLYLKLDWRWMALGRKLKNLRYQRQEAKLNKRRQEAEDIMKKVDAILDKINEVGLENLTRAERRFLEEASSELSKQKEHRKR
jgi:membrane associated rhomboid family serine protease